MNAPAPLTASVAVAAPLPHPLSYRVPPALRDQAQAGVRVLVPLGRRRVVGYLLALAEGEEEDLKEILEVLDREPLLPVPLLSLLRRAADYYCHPLGEVIRAALPAGLSGRGRQTPILRERLFRCGDRQGEPRGPRQREILDFVRARGEVPLAELRRGFPSPHAPLNRLVEEGFLEERSAERRRDPFLDQPVTPDSPPEPTREQATALDLIHEALEGGGFAPVLLQGVTGSGKTEVYLRAIAESLRRNRRALVLVPEIALTPQLVGRFRARFAAAGSAVAVLHSGLSDGERYDAWRAIARGEVAIVIGARSAVFAPQPELGVIVVDEEHEASYKQGEGFRYHARDLALLRGQAAGAVVLLGSATPSLGTYHRAASGQTRHLTLEQRAGSRAMPRVEVIDLGEERPAGQLAPPLATALAESLAAGDQALLLLNRRGFAPFLLCADCGTTFRCPNCEITLTFHQERRRLLCHYCDYAVPPPGLCPRCGGMELEPEGAGTERLTAELQAAFPGVGIARMDRDTTATKGAHQRLVERMLRREIDILVGTQMVAKGHDFPGVTVVGVLGVDSLLNFPDFRSAERTFSLLVQVAGRAGRGDRPGRVFVQTRTPDHYAITCAAKHDFGAFYAQESAFRSELGYPPFGHLVNLVVSGLDGERVAAAAGQVAGFLEERSRGAAVLGPAPCPLARLRGRSRQQILLKAPDRSPLRRLLAYLPEARKQLPHGIALAVDVDPVDML